MNWACKNIVLLFAMALMVSCGKDDALSIVYPKEYLPAYPGSWWEYSNGDVSKVHTEYVAHSYEPSINSPQSSGEKLVPYIDNRYLYEYEITQSSTKYPLKKLLSEKVGELWEINETGNQKIFRKTTQSIDSIYLRFPSDEHALDSTLYYDILVVVEYLESLDANRWNIKEYYSKNVGLIRKEINNPYDTIAAVVEKQLVDNFINK